MLFIEEKRKKDNGKLKKGSPSHIVCKPKLHGMTRQFASPSSSKGEKVYWINFAVMALDDSISTSFRGKERNSSEEGIHSLDLNDMVSEIRNLLIYDLLDSISSLTSSLGKIKRKIFVCSNYLTFWKID